MRKPERQLQRHGAIRASHTFLCLAACIGAVAVPRSALATPVSAASITDYTVLVAEAARRFHIPQDWIWAVMKVESRGNSRAISPKGAMGLMQLMPSTWSHIRMELGLGADPFEPRDNITAGAAYISSLQDRYGAPGWIAAYNAGPRRYEAALRGRALPSETRNYLAMLAPTITSGGGATPGSIMAADPLAWTHSALFIEQGPHQTFAHILPANPSATESPQPTRERLESAKYLQSRGLFVARNGDGAVP